MVTQRSFSKTLTILACLPLTLALAAACGDESDGGGSGSEATGGEAGGGTETGGTDSGTGGKGSGSESSGGSGSGGKAAGGSGSGGKGSGGSATGGSGTDTGGMGGWGGIPDPDDDGDDDGDLVKNGRDNCPSLPNEDQKDDDNDDVGNACDVDIDGDRLIEVWDLEGLDRMRYAPEGRYRYDGVANDSTGCPAAACAGYELMADVDFDTNEDGAFDANDDFYEARDGSGSPGWAPFDFSGTFEGNGHHIRNLYVMRDQDNVGFFGKVTNVFEDSAAIRNVTFDGPLTQVSGGGHVGIVAGRIEVDPSTGDQTRVISNVKAVGVVSATFQFAGGLVGSVGVEGTDRGGSFRIESSSFQGKVTASDTTGGLVGELLGLNGCLVEVADSFANAEVKSTEGLDSNGTGGLIGRAWSADAQSAGDAARIVVERSYGQGSVESKNGCAGGVLGRIYSSYAPVEVINSFTVSQVNAKSNAGGLSGCVVTVSNFVHQMPLFENNLVLGKITDQTDWRAALAGTWAGIFTGVKNYWATDTTGQTSAVPFVTEMFDSYGTTQSKLACPTAATNTSCDSKTLFDGWSQTVWSYGTSSQLPALVIGGATHRPTYDSGTSKFGVTVTALP